MEVVVGRDAVHLGISPYLSLWWSPADIKGKKQEENGMDMLHKKKFELMSSLHVICF